MNAPRWNGSVREGGRGLLTVDALATTWSWTGTPETRTIRATFPARSRREI